MAEEGFAGLSPKDITVDEEGRVIITDPEVAERLRGDAQLRRRVVNHGCNTVTGCGTGQNIGCNFTR